VDPLILTQRWLSEVVINLGLCPFAHEVIAKDKLFYNLLAFDKADMFIDIFNTTAKHILDPETKETTAILIIEKGLDSFTDYMNVYNALEDHLTNVELSSEIQLASFHPDYQFEGTRFDAVENYTNRSPFPLIHLLKVAEVEQAIALHPDIDKVPITNIETMKKLGLVGVQRILAGLRLPNIL